MKLPIPANRTTAFPVLLLLLILVATTKTFIAQCVLGMDMGQTFGFWRPIVYDLITAAQIIGVAILCVVLWHLPKREDSDAD